MLYFMFIVFSLVSYGKCERLQEIIEYFKTFLEKRCAENVGNNSFFTNILNSFNECRSNLAQSTTTDRNEDETCIERHVSETYSCLKNLTDTLEACLESEEKYLPNYVLNYFNSSIVKQCNGEATASFEVCPTIVNNSTSIATVLFDKCVSNLYTLNHLQDIDFVLKKEDTCSDAEKLKSCIVDRISEVCQDEAIHRVYLIYITPYLDACEQDKSNKNN